MKKRVLSLILALCLMVGILPATALALEDMEPNDTLAAAQEFEICDTINGSISEVKGADWYKFTLEASGKITLKMSSYMKYYTLSLYNSDSERIWSDDYNEWDSTVGVRTDSYSMHVAEGTYYIRVTSQRYLGDTNSKYFTTGDYVLKTDYINANATEQEDNDSIAQANELPLYGSVNGQIAMNDSFDFYKIALPASGRLTMNMTAYDMGYNTLVLFNSDYQQVWSDAFNSMGDSSNMRNEVYNIDLLGGIYYIKVSGEKHTDSNITTTGTYTLAVDYVNANTNEVEPNNSIAEAHWVAPNKAVVAQIALNDSKDFFQFTLKRDMALTIDFTSYMPAYLLQLYDEAGNRIWDDGYNSWDSSTHSRHDTYTIDLTQGTYTLSVLCAKSTNNTTSLGTGNYTFKLNTENPFTDVPEGSFYYDPVLWAVEQGITSGTTGTTFSPNDSCMRAHVVTFLWRAAGCPEPGSTENPFVDVQSGSFYEKPVLWAVENGITNGADATHFDPTGVCNRAQVVTFLYRAFGSPAVSTEGLPFTDVPAGAWYEAPIAWAVENGITNGLTATEFGPNASCNRAQVVTFLYRAYN